MENENVNPERGLPDIPAQAKKNPPLTRPEAWKVLPVGATAALLYAVCFSGTQILPQISFTLFCPVVFFLLTGLLKSLGRFKNKRALWWGCPIAILAVYNGLFHANLFTWTNAMIMHGLFAAYTLTALREQPTDLFNLTGLASISRLIFGNWTAFVGVFRTVVTGRRTSEAAPTRQIHKILLGALVAMPVLFVIVFLLASADAVFNKLVEDLANAMVQVEWLNTPFILSFVMVWIYAVGYVCLSFRQSRYMKPVPYPAWRADVTICATFLVLLNAVFLLFTFVQVAFLFNGGFLTLPADMVYSQYAREGFFQLLFVTVINFSVIIVFMTVLTGVNRSRLLRGLLLALCFFTGVLIVSSFYRMGLYTGVYGHTTLRLWVYTFLTMETALLAITVWKLFNDRVPFIRWFVLTAFAFYLVVNVTGSDYFAAKLNKELFLSGQIENIDLYPVGPDGLRVLQPLINDDDYICVDYKIIRINDYNKQLYDPAYSTILTWDDLTRERIPYNYTQHWQNWSYLKLR